MKTIQLNKIALAVMSLALFVGSAGTAIAGEASIKDGTFQVIQLHAPNNATQTVTIWTPKTAPRSTGKIATARNAVPKLIELPASNSNTQSVTVWMSSAEKKIEVAPLK